MGKAEEIKQRIVGKTKQAVGEIIGDQSLHDDGKAQARGGDGPDTSGRPIDSNDTTALNKTRQRYPNTFLQAYR